MRDSVLKMCRGPDLLGHQVVRGSFEARQQAKAHGIRWSFEGPRLALRPRALTVPATTALAPFSDCYLLVDVHNADCLAATAANSVKSKVSLKCRHEPRRSRRVPGCLDRQRLIAGVERCPLQEIRCPSAECSARRSAM